jgi:hypothetical protein
VLGIGWRAADSTPRSAIAQRDDTAEVSVLSNTAPVQSS